MQAVCHGKSGGCGNGVGNDAGASLAVWTEAGALDVIFDVGAADAGGCVGTGGAANCGGWSEVGIGNAADKADAIDGAIDTAGAGWTGADVGIWNADDDPGAAALAILDDADDEAGPLVAGGARDRDAQVNAGSLRCSGTLPGDHVKTTTKLVEIRSTTSCYHPVASVQSLSYATECASILSLCCGCADP